MDASIEVNDIMNGKKTIGSLYADIVGHRVETMTKENRDLLLARIGVLLGVLDVMTRTLKGEQDALYRVAVEKREDEALGGAVGYKASVKFDGASLRAYLPVTYKEMVARLADRPELWSKVIQSRAAFIKLMGEDIKDENIASKVFVRTLTDKLNRGECKVYDDLVKEMTVKVAGELSFDLPGRR